MAKRDGTLKRSSRDTRAALEELARSWAEVDRLMGTRAIKFLELPGAHLADARDRFQRMVRVVGDLTPKARECLSLAEEKLNTGAPGATFEADTHARDAQRATSRALNASREAELTLRKVEEILTRRPKANAATVVANRRGVPSSEGTGCSVTWWLVFGAVGVSIVFGSFGDYRRGEDSLRALLCYNAFGGPMTVIGLWLLMGIVQKALDRSKAASLDWSAANGHANGRGDGLLKLVIRRRKRKQRKPDPHRVAAVVPPCCLLRSARSPSSTSFSSSLPRVRH